MGRACAVAIWLLAGCRSILGFEDPVLLDDEEISIGFEFAESGADEVSGTVVVPVVLSGVTEEPISVGYGLLTSTATPGADFILSSGTLVFAAGEVRKEIPVTIANDTDMTELVESIDIALDMPVGGVLDEQRAIHRVMIADHVLPRVNLSATSTTSSESQPSMLVLMLDRPAEADSSVVIGVAGGTAAPASTADVMIVDNTLVTIPTGATSVMIPIGEINDTLDEEDAETIVFTLRGASVNLVLGITKTLNHAILDNDAPPNVLFNASTSTVTENVVLGAATLDVRLSAASGRMVRVNYTRDATDTADDTDAAVMGSPGTLTFNPGEMTKTIIVAIDNDNVDEDNETVVVDLSNAVNTTITNATHTLTINDNDTAIVSFSMASRTVTEGAIVSVMVTMDRPSSKTVAIPFSVMGTATNNDDYMIQTSSPIVLNPGQTSQTIVIDVVDNLPGNEANETVVLDLGTPTGGAVRGTPNRFTLTINES